MHNILALSVAALLALGIMTIGTLYIANPRAISKSFGLKPPASDADTYAWLRLKGIRDIASGLVVLTMMFVAADRHSVALALLGFAVVPFGDMSNILASGGSRQTAFSVHGVTCLVMVVVGLVLLHGV